RSASRGPGATKEPPLLPVEATNICSHDLFHTEQPPHPPPALLRSGGPVHGPMGRPGSSAEASMAYQGLWRTGVERGLAPMNLGQIAAGLLLGLTAATSFAKAEEPLSTRDAMVRAQIEAQRRGGTDLLERVESERVERPGKRGFRPRETDPVGPLPDIRT